MELKLKFPPLWWGEEYIDAGGGGVRRREFVGYGGAGVYRFIVPVASYRKRVLVIHDKEVLGQVDGYYVDSVINKAKAIAEAHHQKWMLAHTEVSVTRTVVALPVGEE